MVKKDAKVAPSTPAHYTEGIGRRKAAVARVRIVKGKGEAMINEKPLAQYFGMRRLTEFASAPLAALNIGDRFNVSAKVRGGGVSAQAEAVRHGLSRALVRLNPEFKKRLRALGYLTRDPRMVERKKYGLKKARRAPQWQKR